MSKVDVKEILSRLVDPLLDHGLEVNTGQCCGKFFAAINEVKLCNTCNTKPISYQVTDHVSLNAAIENVTKSLETK